MPQTRLLSATTLRARESRRLLAWALERGADEFSLAVRAMHGVDAPLADAFEDALAPWTAPSAHRRVTDGGPGPDATREVRLWTLTPLSLALLDEFLPDGLFTAGVHARGWLEDPIVYRRGDFLLGALTHQREGVARVSAEEARELEQLGIPLGIADDWPSF